MVERGMLLQQLVSSNNMKDISDLTSAPRPALRRGVREDNAFANVQSPHLEATRECAYAFAASWTVLPQLLS